MGVTHLVGPLETSDLAFVRPHIAELVDSGSLCTPEVDAVTKSDTEDV